MNFLLPYLLVFASPVDAQRLCGAGGVDSCSTGDVQADALLQTGRSPLARQPTPDEDLAASSLVRFVYAGEGSCIDVHGREPQCTWVEAAVDGDGFSAGCEERCRQSPGCSGFATERAGRCCLVEQSGFLPSDGSEGRHCFWRHDYLYDNSSRLAAPPLPVPKILWSFWQQADPAQAVLPLVSVCVESWRALNPDFEVRVLNLTSMWRWLTRADLPARFDELQLQHQADAVRFSLLEKYGGVWLDASVLLLRPLPALWHGAARAFVVHAVDSQHREHRLPATRIANWLLSAAPGDLLMTKARACFQQLHGEANVTLKDILTPRQLQEMGSLHVDEYLGAYACILQALDQDRGLEAFFHGPKVRRVDLGFTFWRDFSWEQKLWVPKLLKERDEDWVNKLLAEDTMLVKFCRMTRAPLQNLTREELVCRNHTLGALLAAAGVGCTPPAVPALA